MVYDHVGDMALMTARRSIPVSIPGCSKRTAASKRSTPSRNLRRRWEYPVCTENLIRVDDALETPKLTE